MPSINIYIKEVNERIYTGSFNITFYFNLKQNVYHCLNIPIEVIQNLENNNGGKYSEYDFKFGLDLNIKLDPIFSRLNKNINYMYDKYITLDNQYQNLNKDKDS